MAKEKTQAGKDYAKMVALFMADPELDPNYVSINWSNFTAAGATTVVGGRGGLKAPQFWRVRKAKREAMELLAILENQTN